MKIQDVMTREVRSCRPESNLADVVRDMWEADCGVLPVIESDGRVVGMITDRDICVAVGTKGRTADQITVREIFDGRDLYSCLPAEDTTAALKTMQAHQVHRLAVVYGEGHLRGIVSINDIVTHKGAASASEIANAMARISEHRASLRG